MALKAGYFGIKKNFLNQLLGLPADISDIRSEQAALGAKNFIPTPYADITKTQNGITFTVNADGSVTVNGTATGNAVFNFTPHPDTRLQRLRGKFIVTTGGAIIPNGMAVNIRKSDDTNIWGINPGMDKIEIELTDSMYLNGWIYIYVANGTTVNNVKIYPMMRLATDPDDTYVPYAMTNRELTEIVALPDSVFTLAEGVSITSNWSCICGRVLNIGLQLEFTSAMSASATVLTMSDYYLGNGKAGTTGMSILATKVSPQAGMYVFDIPAGSGPIKVRNVQAVAQGEKVCITGTYIIK